MSIQRKTFGTSCPTIGICLMLAMGIAIAHFHWLHLPYLYWLLILLGFVAGSIVVRNINTKTTLLYVSILAMGGTLTAWHETSTCDPVQVYTYQDLTSLDKAKLRMLDYRQHLAHQYESHHVEHQDYAIVAAMTLGDKTNLSQDTRHTFSSSGASHVLAISGLHIGIIFQMLILLLGRNKKHQLFSLPLSLLAIWAYVFFIGLPASAVRSAFMISVYCFSLLTRRNSPAINSLALAAIIMLLINTTYLFDVSFQLSFSAVLSILLLYKHIFRLLPQRVTFFGPIKWIWGMMSVSLAAQIGTAPLIAYYFGTLSYYSLVSSLIAIPAATIILYTSLALLIASAFISLASLQDFLSIILSFVATLTQRALEAIAQLPGASIEGIKINIPQLGLIYVTIIVGCLLIHKLRQCHLHQIHLATFVDTDYTHRECQT